MPMLFESLNLTKAGRELFITKLGIIYGMWQSIAKRWPDKEK